MPWNSQGGGGWHGGRRPRARGAAVPAAAGSSRPTSRSCCAAARSRSRACFPAAAAGIGGRRGIVLVAVAVVALWLASGFYRGPAGRAGRGAALRQATTARPAGPATTTCRRRSRRSSRPQVTRVNRIEIGFRSAGQPGTPADGAVRDVPEEALMLTGDENIIDINFVVLWRINDAADVPVQHPRSRRTP